jgi:Na+/H+ antiporter
MTGPQKLETVLLLFAVVLLGMSAARRIPIPYPVLLVLAGLGLGLAPGLPAPRLDPEIVFLLFLPPVLWSAAYSTSLRDFRRAARPITLLAVGLVCATTAAVAFAARELFPSLSWAAAIALGAIVSPPDAVSATAVIRTLGVPRRVVTVLEGESLVNDATALILYRAAVAALAAGTFDLAHSLLDFFVAAGLGIAIGLAVGFAVALALSTTRDSLAQILITLMAPYFAWTIGERAHASAVLACVVGGLVLRRSFSTVAPATRLQGRAVWDLVLFVVNGTVFLLIGLQLPTLVADVPEWRELVGPGVLIASAAIAIRLVWVPLVAWIPRALSPALAARDPMPSWQTLFLVAWSGLRGIVSLAAALALPLTVAGGAPLPFRSELILITFIVIFVTLVVQGLLLAPIVTVLRFPIDEEPALEERRARAHAAGIALGRIAELEKEPWADSRTLASLRETYRGRLARAEIGTDTEEGAASSLAERGSKRARFETLLAERLALIRLRDEGVIGDEVLVVLEAELDLEAARHGLADLHVNDAGE